MMIAVNFLQRIFLCVLLVSLSGCSVPVTVRLFNNSDYSYVIYQVSGARQEKHYELNARESVDIKFWESDQILVIRNGAALSYETGMFPAGFGKTYGWGPFIKRIVKVQLEKDGSIYLVSPDGQFPLNNFSGQPDGWPVNGKTAEKPGPKTGTDDRKNRDRSIFYSKNVRQVVE